MDSDLSKVNSNISEILTSYKKIAVVGLSPKTYRPSYAVASYMLKTGFQIFPVNPGHDEILGQKCYASLSEIPEGIEIVNIFRNSAAVLPVVLDAINVGAKVIWMQSGIINDKAARLAMKAGLDVVMDACIKVEHSFLPHS